jgi:acyl carrier protein
MEGRELPSAITAAPASAAADAPITRDLAALIKEISRFEGELDADDDFLTKAALTSLQTVQLTVRLDDRFGIKFGTEAEDFEALASLGRLAELVDRRRGR